VGLTGDISKGEFEQIANFNGPVSTGMLSNWTRATIDPCTENPLSSTSCPGFGDTLSKITATTNNNTIDIPTSTNTSAESQPIQSNVVVSVPSSFQSISIAPVTTQIEQPITNEQQNSSMSIALNTIRNNARREESIANNAVSMANQTAQAASQAAEQAAMTIASESASQAMDFARDSSNNQSTNSSAINSQFSLLPSNLTRQATSQIAPSAQQNQTQTQMNTVSQQYTAVNINAMSMNDIANLPAGLQNFSLRPTESVATQNTTNIVDIIPQATLLPPSNPLANTSVDIPSSGTAFFTNRGDPFQDYLEKNAILVSQPQPDIKNTTVRANVQDSTLAGNVRVERMAVVPNGYNLYLSLVMRDVAFYETKEIYKNNTIKDNARTMYFIEKGNTDTYNKMIEAQYR
jgi:hypothetical protein